MGVDVREGDALNQTTLEGVIAGKMLCFGNPDRNLSSSASSHDI
jgi:hypothetical protein